MGRLSKLKTMKSLIIRIATRLARHSIPDSIRYKNMILPAKHLRFCRDQFKDNEYFLASAQQEVDRLVEHCGLTKNSHLLDIGCGPGRLPIGILNRMGAILKYRGVDVSEPSIRWCQRYIAQQYPSYQFSHINVHNARYNPNGKPISENVTLPFDDQEFDIIYLLSVFTHMTKEDVIEYLKECERMLSPSGKIFLTAYLKDGVPSITINPQGYKIKWTGPLHCVQYDKRFFEALLAERGLSVDHYSYEELDEQTGVYISKRKNDAG